MKRVFISQPMRGKTDEDRGCNLDHEAAKQYGIKVMYYDEKPKAETDGFITAGV